MISKKSKSNLEPNGFNGTPKSTHRKNRDISSPALWRNQRSPKQAWIKHPPWERKVATTRRPSSTTVCSKPIDRRPKIWTICWWLIRTILPHIGLPIHFKSRQIVHDLRRRLTLLQFKFFLIHKMRQICCMTTGINMISSPVLLFSHLHDDFPLLQRRTCFGVHRYRDNGSEQPNHRQLHTTKRNISHLNREQR